MWEYDPSELVNFKSKKAPCARCNIRLTCINNSDKCKAYQQWRKEYLKRTKK